MKNLIEEKLIGLGHCFSRRANAEDRLLIAFGICGIRNLQAARHCILRASHRVATRAGSYRLEVHCSGRAPQEIPQSVRRDQPASSDKH